LNLGELNFKQVSSQPTVYKYCSVSIFFEFELLHLLK